MQRVADGHPDLAGVAQLQEALIGVVRRDQSEIKAILGVVRESGPSRPRC